MQKQRACGAYSRCLSALPFHLLRMDPTLRKKLYTEEDAIENHEQLGFLPQAFSTKPSHKGRNYSLCHVLTLYVMIIVLFAAVIALGATRMSPDPGLSLWCKSSTLSQGFPRHDGLM